MENIKKGFVAVFLALLVAMVTMLPAAAVDGTTAERTLPVSAVTAGAEFTVTVDVSNFGDLAQVTETLPSGFDFVSSTGVFNAEVDGDDVTFTIFAGTTSFEYIVGASDTAGSYAFAGSIVDEDGVVTGVTNDFQVDVIADGNGGDNGNDNGVDNGNDCLAERTLPVGPFTAGEEFTVTIDLGDFGDLGQVTETLPASFDYVSSTGVFNSEVDGDDVTFTIFAGTTSFEYIVTATDTPGTYDFAGSIVNDSQETSDVCGDTEVVVENDTTGSTGNDCLAERTLPVDPVIVGDEFTVTIDLGDFGDLGQVTETLPAGFDYVSSTGVFDAVVDGDDVTFTVFAGTTSFEYTVGASDTAGSYDFAGTITDDTKQTSDVCEDTEVVVEEESAISATRDLPDEPVNPCGQFTVNIAGDAADQTVVLTETLPEGFEFVSSTYSDMTAVDGIFSFNNLTGIFNFEYTVNASNDEGIYTFSGVVDGVVVRGETDVEVVIPEGIAILPSEEKWISTPFALDNSSVEHILKDTTGLAISQWDCSAQIWVGATDMVPLRGYAVWNGGECTQVIPFDVFVPSTEPMLPMPSLDICDGYNYIGLAETVPAPANLALSSLGDSWATIRNSEGLIGHNGETGDLGGNRVGEDVFTMEPYAGYLLIANQDDTLYV